MAKRRSQVDRLLRLRRLAWDFLFAAFGRYGQFIVTIITLPVVARVLGADGLGLLAIAQSAYFVGSVIADLSLTQLMAALVVNDSIREWRASFAAIRVTIVILIGFALGCAVFVVEVNTAVFMILLGLLCGAFSSLAEDWVLIGQGRFGASFVYQGVGRAVYLVMLLTVLPRYPTPWVAMVCLLVSTTPTVVLTWIDTTKRLGWPKSPTRIREVLEMAAPVLGARLLMMTYGLGSPMIYSGVLSAYSLGLFTASDRLVRAAQSLLDVIPFILLPRFARRKDSHFYWGQVGRGILVYMPIALLITAGLWLATPPLILLIFGDGFVGAIPIMRTFVLILPATALTSYAISAVLAVRKDTNGMLIGGLLGTMVAAVALVVATKTSSVWTLVYGTLAAEILVAVWYAFRMWQLSFRERRVEQVD